VRARDLADPTAVVGVHEDAAAVVRRLVVGGWDGIVVVDGGRTLATVSLAQVLRLLLPDYVEEDESLAAVYSESLADALGEALDGQAVGDVLPQPRREPVVVPADATLVQVAAAMARHACSVVAVVERQQVLGAVGAHAVLAAATRG
jgi:predicted transcriptional regulator